MRGVVMEQMMKIIEDEFDDPAILFDSSLHHKLSNPAREKAELIVVIYIP